MNRIGQCESCDDLKMQLLKSLEEVERLKEDKLRIVRGEFELICSYCGWESGEGDGWEQLQQHIKVCDKHPLTSLQAKLDKSESDFAAYRAVVDSETDRISAKLDLLLPRQKEKQP